AGLLEAATSVGSCFQSVTSTVNPAGSMLVPTLEPPFKCLHQPSSSPSCRRKTLKTASARKQHNLG
ncbi:MAG: hypothetical protein U1C47_03775, partial [Hydrogenophaga sp.]|nr:hypothetical protein [Hydrogenophaga sp.]